MRLLELELLEKIASAGKMNVGLGETGLADKLLNAPLAAGAFFIFR